MTTDRPYAAALALNEAMLQIHAGRGKQFNPAVVDAFRTVATAPPGRDAAAGGYRSDRRCELRARDRR